MRERSTSQYVYLVVILLLGVGSVVAIFYRATIVMPPTTVLLVGVAIAYVVTDYYGILIETARPGSYYELTVANASAIFGLMVAGPYGLLPILIGSIIVRYMQRKWEQPLGYLFNAAHLATSCCLWLALDITLLSLDPMFAHGILYLGRLAALMALYLLWDIFFFSLLISIGSTQPILAVCRQKLTPTAWLDMIPIIMGALAALVFTINPWLIFLVILPLFLAYRAMAAVVHRLELTTALQSANAQLAQLNAELEQRVYERTVDLERAMRAKDDFVAVVTHELRTPLTSIVGSLGVLADSLPPTISSRTRRMVAVAYKNSERLTRLINDILDLQKFTTHSMTFHLQPVDITALVDQAVETNRPYARSFDVALSVIHGAQGWFVLGDHDRLLQVLTNLLSNACKFSPSGGQVTVTTTVLEQRVRVTVADRGQGIPEAFRAHVFEKFTQADASSQRRVGGSGLGLNIAKSIIDAFDGTIGFATECGVGTTFFFELSGRINETSEQAREVSRQHQLHDYRGGDA